MNIVIVNINLHIDLCKGEFLRRSRDFIYSKSNQYKETVNYIFPSFELYDDYETIINKINKENPDEVYIEHLLGKFDDDIIVYTNYGAKFIAEGVKVSIYVPKIVYVFDPLYGSSIKIIYKEYKRGG